MCDCLIVNFVRLNVKEMGVDFMLPNRCYSKIHFQILKYGLAKAFMTLITDFPSQLTKYRLGQRWLN